MYRPKINFQQQYAAFNENIFDFDCGQKCLNITREASHFAVISVKLFQQHTIRNGIINKKQQICGMHGTKMIAKLNEPNQKNIETDLVGYQILIAVKDRLSASEISEQLVAGSSHFSLISRMIFVSGNGS